MYIHEKSLSVATKHLNPYQKRATAGLLICAQPNATNLPRFLDEAGRSICGTNTTKGWKGWAFRFML